MSLLELFATSMILGLVLQRHLAVGRDILSGKAKGWEWTSRRKRGSAEAGETVLAGYQREWRRTWAARNRENVCSST